MVGPFKKAQGGLTHLFVAVDKFSKWIEAKPVATIIADKARDFFSSTSCTTFHYYYCVDYREIGWKLFEKTRYFVSADLKRKTVCESHDARFCLCGVASYSHIRTDFFGNSIQASIVQPHGYSGIPME